MKNVVIYTDGACKNNPGPGGYACIITYEGKEKVITGSDPETTNNRMELMGVISGLKALIEPCNVTIVSDSKYVCDSISKGWMENWKNNNWVKSTKTVVPNKDLWIILDELLHIHNVDFQWIKGHNGHEYNERCDRLAVNEILNLLNKKKETSNISIFADNASGTKVKSEVVLQIKDTMENNWVNPDSEYSLGINNGKILKSFKIKLANMLDCKENELYFVSSGSEANNLAVIGFARANKDNGKHIICSSIEHPSVIKACEMLKDEGFEISYVNPNMDGVVEVNSIKNSIRKDTILVCVMHANNETGVINPIYEIAELCHKNKIKFFSDGVAAIPYYDVSMSGFDVDMYSISGYKFGSPPGIGVLYVKDGIKISPIIVGGNQENGRRAGAYNLPYIAGLVKAFELSRVDIRQISNIQKKRDIIINKIQSEIPDVLINGIRSKRLPNYISLSAKGINSDLLVTMLNEKKIYVSKGTTCVNDREYSSVLSNMGVPYEYLKGSIRISLGFDITEEESEYLANVIIQTIKSIKQ